MSFPDEDLTRLLAEAAPRAPASTVDRVMAAIERQRRRRRRLLVAGALAAAAAVFVLVLKPRPQSPPAGAPVVANGLRTVEPGHPLTLELARGRATIERGEVRLADDALWMESGAGRLTGDGARVDTPVARLTALGADAEVEFELRRTPMDAKKTVTVAAGAAATLLAVHVLAGGARIDAAGAHTPTQLGPGDRALVASGAPPLAIRTPPAAHTPSPAPPTAQPARAASTSRPSQAVASRERPTETDESPSTAEVRGSLDREAIQDGIRTLLPDIKACYETALEKHPDLQGRVVVEMKIKAKDGQGVIDEAEIIPQEGDDDLNSPSTEHCLLQAMTNARFPAPDGDVVVRYPFILKTE
jgi:hypothetical protein